MPTKPVKIKENDMWQLLLHLSELLRQTGDAILSGEARLSLGARCICRLAEFSRSLADSTENGTSAGGKPDSCNNGTHDTVPRDIQAEANFVSEFISKTPRLRVVHSGGPLDGAVRIAVFEGLQELEVQRLPIHLLEGLNHLRGQLQHLSISRSLQSLQDVFEVCGGDQSAPMTWPALLFVDVSFNDIMVLDTSLRLLPQVHTLNLSHNRIRMTEHNLEYLTNLRHINLAYNRLTAVPSFSLTTNTYLNSLILAYNNLSDIQGVEVLTGLEELDLSGNCLSRHASLKPLACLSRLRELRLQANPLSCHPQHRHLVLMNMSRSILVSQFRLDDKVLSKSEAKLCQCAVRAANEAQRWRFGERDSDGSLSQNTGPSILASSVQIGPPRSRKRRRRQRRAIIADLESSTTEVSSRESSRAPSPSSVGGAAASPSTRREVERLRQHLGPLWLAAMGQSSRSLAPRPVYSSEIFDSPPGTRTTPSPLRQPSPPPLHRQRAPELWNQTAETRSGGSMRSPNQDDIFLTDTSANQPGNHHHRGAGLAGDAGSGRGDALNDVNCVDGVYLSSSRAPVGLQPAQQTPAVQVSKSEMPPLLVVTSGPSQEGLGSPLRVEPKSHLLSPRAPLVPTAADRPASPLTPSASGPEWFRTEEQEAKLYGDESEPFIVQRGGDASSTLLVAVNERYLLEKNINGRTIERLDLTSLLDVNCREQGETKEWTDGRTEGSKVEGGKNHHQTLGRPELSLKFDYVHKDRRQRVYVMEDGENCKKLQELLQPFLEERSRATRLSTDFQCLMCSQEWEVRHHHDNRWNKTFSAEELAEERACKVCPRCGSAQVIQLETGQTSTTVSSLPSSLTDSRPSRAKDGHGVVGSIPGSSRPGCAEETMVGRPRSNAFLLSSSIDASPTAVMASRESRFSSQLLMPSAANERLASRIVSFPDLQRHSDLEGRGERLPQSEQKTSLPFLGSASSQNGPSASTSEAGNLDAVEESTVRGEPVQCRRLQSEESDIAVLPATSEAEPGAGPGEGEEDQVVVEGLYGSPISVLDSVSQSLASSVLWNSLHGSPPTSQPPVHSPSNTPSTASNQGPHGDARDNGEEDEEPSIYDIPHQKQVSFSVGSSSSPLEVRSLVALRDPGETAPRRRDSGPELSRLLGREERRISEVLGDIDILPVHESPACGAGQTGELSEEWTGDAALQRLSITDAGSRTTSDSSRGMEKDGAPQDSVAASQGRTEVMERMTGRTMARDEMTEGGEGESSASSCCVGENNPFLQVDHHLKLFLLMSVFKDDEECLGVLRCSYVQYMMEKEVPGLLVISSARLYILRVLADQPTDCPESWLQVVDAQPLGELRYVDPGLGHQSVRLEFNTELSCYTLILRDANRTQSFMSFLEETLSCAAVQIKEQLNVVINDDPDAGAMEMMKADVLAYSPTPSTLLAYIMGFIARGSQARYPVSFAVSLEDVCLVRENHQYPAPRLQAPQDWTVVGKRFTVLERRPISTIASLTMDELDACRLRIAFFNEEAEAETSWLVTLVSENSLTQLTEALRQPWEAIFGVELEVARETITADDSDEKSDNLE